MKILVFGPRDRYAVYRPAVADALDAELVFRVEDKTDLETARENADAQILFVDAISPVGAEVMDALPDLRLIHSEGVAYNCIDCAAASARGIAVCNNQGCNAAAVAEHTIMLMLMALRRGITAHRAVVEGRQIQMKQQVIAAGSPGLFQCSVGLVGFGDTARATAERLRPFGCHLYYYNVHRRAPEIEAAYGVQYLPLEDLAARCDVISLHCAVVPETVGMIDADFLARMKPGAVLVNCARGALVDNAALRAALIEGRIGCAALDTIEPEPTPADHPLVALPPEARDRAIYSAHLGGSSGGCFAAAHRTMWENAARVLRGDRPLNLVNDPVERSPT